MQTKILAIGVALLVMTLLFTGVAAPRAHAQDIPADAAALQAAFAQREAAYQEQLTQLNQAYAERQRLYQQQIDEMNRRLATVQQQVQAIRNQDATLRQQIAQLQSLRAERQAQYRSQLEQMRAEYANRAAAISAQLTDVQTRLAEANAMLGR
ncbi:MAG TPA: hypothetical protein DCL15_11975 [Chloroflexi bacterium]|nr:hypothetical protein [Chloroflexota bacterium]HHW86748.1 hypothetical protein [Chloroflexota bacterium]